LDRLHLLHRNAYFDDSIAFFIKIIDEPPSHATMSTSAASSHSVQDPAEILSATCPERSEHCAGDDERLLRMDLILQTMRNRKISLSALHALTNLYLNRPCKLTLSQLAGNLGLTTAAVTSVADALEKLEFAKRFFDHRDRRLTRLSLTPRGHAFAEWIGESIGGRADAKNTTDK
jgi:DNA-binding MarR family transcriptional regulator